MARWIWKDKEAKVGCNRQDFMSFKKVEILILWVSKVEILQAEVLARQ